MTCKLVESCLVLVHCGWWFFDYPLRRGAELAVLLKCQYLRMASECLVWVRKQNVEVRSPAGYRRNWICIFPADVLTSISFWIKQGQCYYWLYVVLGYYLLLVLFFFNDAHWIADPWAISGGLKKTTTKHCCGLDHLAIFSAEAEDLCGWSKYCAGGISEVSWIDYVTRSRVDIVLSLLSTNQNVELCISSGASRSNDFLPGTCINRYLCNILMT